MRIAQVCPRYHPHIGGIETHVEEVSERLVQKGFDVDVLTTDPTGGLPRKDMLHGVSLMRFSSWAPRDSYYVSCGLKKYLARNSRSYDVVHAHSYHAFPALYSAYAKTKNALVFSPHYGGTGHTFFRSLLHIPYGYLAGNIFRKADRIVCASRYEKSLVMKMFGIGEAKVLIIPSGVNPDEFRPSVMHKNDHRSILYVGRLEKYKGIDYLLKVTQKLNGDVALRIIGEGPHEKTLMKLADQLGLRERVTFQKHLARAELLQRYAEADVFISLSRHEAFGITVADALASGTPCIVANRSALREWIDDENCFGISYPIDIEELAQMINSIMGRSVDSTALRLPTWDEAVQKLIACYLSLS